MFSLSSLLHSNLLLVKIQPDLLFYCFADGAHLEMQKELLPKPSSRRLGFYSGLEKQFCFLFGNSLHPSKARSLSYRIKCHFPSRVRHEEFPRDHRTVNIGDILTEIEIIYQEVLKIFLSCFFQCRIVHLAHSRQVVFM